MNDEDEECSSEHRSHWPTPFEISGGEGTYSSRPMTIPATRKLAPANAKERQSLFRFRLSLTARNWPDSGLTRNTRCRCYRCSVPGLAGFTRLTLCGARSLINSQQLRGERITDLQSQ